MSDSVQAIPAEILNAFAERSPRSETDWPGAIRTSDGLEIQCKIKNVSKTGAKVEVSEAYYLPETFLLKFGKNFVCRVRLAWRRGRFTGLKVEQISKIDA